MMWLLIFSAACALAILAGFFLLSHRAVTPLDFGLLDQHLVAIDLKSLANLLDPAQEQFLKDTLSLRNYQKTRRRRVTARIAYTEAIFRNAGVLLRASFALELNPEVDAPRVRELSESASRLRLNCLKALATLYVDYCLPLASYRLARISSDYRHVMTTAIWAGSKAFPNVAIDLNTKLS